MASSSSLSGICPSGKKTVCICGAGNAAHVFIPYFANEGFNVTVFADFKDEAARLLKGQTDNGGIMIHDRCDPKNIKEYKGSASVISKDASKTVPQADYIIVALPSFAMTNVFKGLKPYLKTGAIIYCMPGQGGCEFVAKEIIGDLLALGEVTMAGVIPMPLNCRIDEWGKKVQLAALKATYDLATIPAGNAAKAAKAFSNLMGGKKVNIIGNYVGIGLHASNPNIHPGRLMGLIGHWKQGVVLPENPLFYETFDDKSAEWCQKISDERKKVWETICQKVPGTGKASQVPAIKPYIESIYAGQIADTSTLAKCFNTNDGYKGFRCPYKQVEGGFVPDTSNRYFTEDIPEGFCMYKGVADLAGVETPVIDQILTFLQGLMGKEYIKNGKLIGRNVPETKSPQAYGINTLEELLSDKVKATVCVCGAGNAAHVFIPYFSNLGYKVTVYADFKDEAERLEKAQNDNGGIMIHDRCDPKNVKEYKGSAERISKDPADVVPQADYIIVALPSFAMKNVFTGLKPHLKPGATIYCMPGQGGVDFVAKQVLGDLLSAGKITMAGVIPMPLNCRISEWGKKVELAALKATYDLASVPAKNAGRAARGLSALLGGKIVKVIDNYAGIALHASNPNIHPGRLMGLISHWKPGVVLPENPLFYETFDDKSAEWCQKISAERVKVWETICKKAPGTGKPGQVPHIKPYIESIYKGQIADTSTLAKCFNTNDGYKGFRCPYKQVEGGFIPDVTNRYFTEDIPEGFCMYKGIADLAGVETPAIDEILGFLQGLMKKEYLKNGKLIGKDVPETKSPQAFGIRTLEDLLKD